MPVLLIAIGSVTIEADLLNTPTARAVAAAAPFTARANLWGEEVYFSTPVAADLEPGAREVITLGEIAFWPPGDAIAIGFGPTPVSVGDEIRLASPANVFARARGDVRALAAVQSGAAITVSLK